MYEFNCTKIGSCISEDLVCDGIANCPDQSDESEEICKELRCPEYSIRCAYGACIDPLKVCDGARDCIDGSDEYSCIVEEECPSEYYQCRSGECIDGVSACDGKADCKDSSDEEENVCLKISCPNYSFRCRYGACVPQTARCSGTSQCLDESDEDELLCGIHYSKDLIKENSTANIEPGSCRLPFRNDLRFINLIFGEEYFSGGYVRDGEYIKIVCSGGTATNVTSVFDSSNSCRDTQWSKDWRMFPKCQTICSGADVIGRTIKTICELNGKVIPCNQQHIVGTTARFKCGSYYQLPNLEESLYFSKKLTCLSSGRWDGIALRCTPVNISRP